MHFQWQDFPNALYYYGEMLKLVPEVSSKWNFWIKLHIISFLVFVQCAIVIGVTKGIEEVLNAAESADFDTLDKLYNLTRETIAPIPGTKVCGCWFSLLS